MTDTEQEKLQTEVRNIVAKIIEVAPEKIELDTQFVEDLNADSMMALEIMAALEKKYHVNIPEDDLPKLATLRQALSLLSGLMRK